MSDLYAANTFSRFWGLSPDVPHEVVQEAAREAADLLPGGRLIFGAGDWAGLMAYVLGEGQFGPAHWRLSRVKRLYYDVLRPLLPRQIRPVLRWLVRSRSMNRFALDWPIEDRYVHFLHVVLEIVQQRYPEVRPAPFWPADARFALVLTHDIETAAGQAFVRRLADLEERYQFRSSFNFVPEGYPIDVSLLAELRGRGFEIGIHGLNHDGRLFASRSEFERQAERINGYLRDWRVVGFRAPFAHRNPHWMQSLAIEYDSSFFDTDPTQTIPGGTMSLWPFFCGRFVELPYTLVQDHILFEMLAVPSPQMWLEKIDFVARWNGMALMNVHPDYVRDPSRLVVYEDFLRQMSDRMNRSAGGDSPYYWHALPRDVARWWRSRAGANETTSSLQEH